MSKTPATLLDALAEQLRAQAGTADGVMAPAAILWTDPESEWLPLVPALLRALPELFVCGTYEPAQRTGPAIWLRCVIDRTLAEGSPAPGIVPIVYLPEVGRQTLHSASECPVALQPLVELMFRGTLWLQRGGHDWTVMAFLTSGNALGLDVARDAATQHAMHNALRELATMPLVRLRSGRFEATDFDQMLSSDVVRDMLRWLGDPEGAKSSMGAETWSAFHGQCEKRFDFDPDSAGVVKGGELMAKADGPWEEVWRRFEEAPEVCPGIPALLRRCRSNTLFDASHWPQRNEKDEERVAAALGDLEGVPHLESCERVLELEKEHGVRRSWVWARLGLAPFAVALERLAVLAEIARRPVASGTPDEIAASHAREGWRADAAAWQALVGLLDQPEKVVREVVQQLAETWLEGSALAFQAAVERMPTQVRSGRQAVEAGEGGCLVFVDGLRFDLGCLLAEKLEGRGCRVELSRRWAALPTVTATGKPAVTPVASDVIGAKLGEDFAPTLRGGKAIDAASLRAAIAAKGYQVLGGEEGDWPLRADARGFVEAGDVDSLGHDLQEHLPGQLPEQLARLVERICRLLDAGWKSVRVVTDHGWLFLPEGLPTAELPKHLTARRWARCAVVSGASQVSVPRVLWHWNDMESAAVAPGISCFNQPLCYAHGGLSIQECLTPDLLVTRGGERRVRASIKSLTWRGMRCFVEAEAEGAEIRADLRLEAANGPSVVKAPKLLEADGSTSLVVADDRHETAVLVLVLLAPDHSVIAQQETKVGAPS